MKYQLNEFQRRIYNLMIDQKENEVRMVFFMPRKMGQSTINRAIKEAFKKK